MSFGVIYIVSGDEYLRKAENSAESLKHNNPELPIHLYTDGDAAPETFDEITRVDSGLRKKGDSILSERHMSYDKTLYLDADTYVAGNIADLFELLDRFEIVAAHNEARAWYHEDFYAEAGIDLPDSFPEYNTGVIAYNDSERVRSLFERWNEIYDDLAYERNQPAFRVALYESDVAIGTVPPEYNFMTHTVGFASGEVRIVHQGSSDADLKKWAERLNSVPGKKVTSWEEAPCRVIPNSYKSKRYKIESLDRRKLATIIRSAKRKRADEGTISLLSAAAKRIQRFVVK